MKMLMKSWTRFILVCCYLVIADSSSNFYETRQLKNKKQERTGHKSTATITDSDTERVFLRVTNDMKNQSAISGESVQFKCKVDGWPKNNIEYTWYKDNLLIDPDWDERASLVTRPWGSKLKIKDLFTYDTGVYRCEASNGERRVFTSASLKVSFVRPPPPSDEEKPFINFPTGECEKYTGVACSDYLKGKEIYVDSFQNQEEMESQIRMAMQHISDTESVSPKCQVFAVPAFCYFVFPVCNSQKTSSSKRGESLCREDCELLKSDICHVEFLRRGKNQFLQDLFDTANCSLLPSSLDSKCTRIGLPFQTNDDQKCYNDNGQEYSGEVSISASGTTCKTWTNRWIGKYPELAGHNFCRNPDKSMEQPWCFVDKARKWKEICDVDKCVLEPAEKSSLFLLVIVIASSCVFLLVSVGTVVFCCIRKRRTNKRSYTRNPEKILHHLQNGTPTPLIFHQQSPKLPQLNPDSIHLLSEIGIGEYGKVYEGTVTDDVRFLTKQPVACKILEGDVTTLQLEQFKREMEILSTLSHPNVTCLKAVINQPGFHCMVMEYTSQVDLHEYLLLNCPNSDLSKQVALDNKCHSLPEINGTDFIRMAIKISAGLEYLERNKFVHRDLAARNILLCGNMELKICNFGMIKDSYKSSYYKLQNGLLLPVRWMAPESLHTWQFSDKTTVWSFGVLLWEMFSYGSLPYCGYGNHEVVDMLSRLQLLPCPQRCPAKIYGLMLNCWTGQPFGRPYFKEIHDRLLSLMEKEEVKACLKGFPVQNDFEVSLAAPTPPPDYVSSYPASSTPSWCGMPGQSENAHLLMSEYNVSANPN